MKGCSWIFDLITAVFLLLSVVVITFVVILLANPRSSINPFPQPTPVSVLVMPTDLPTWTPSATFTPEPATRTPLPTATATPTATFTPSRIPPSFTPSNTPVLGVRATATRPGSRSSQTATLVPPTLTPSGFQFVARPVQYDANKTSEGCKWSSIAGSVIDAGGNPVRGIAVSVQGGGGTIDETQYSGQERRFGEGGFEVFLGSQPRADDYTLTVLGKTGAALSEPLKVRTRTSCTENVVIVTFVQTR